jgi:hypothetical protein
LTISLKRSTQNLLTIHKLGRPITPSDGAKADAARRALFGRD